MSLPAKKSLYYDALVILFILGSGGLTIPVAGTNLNNNGAKYLHQAAELQAGREMSMYKNDKAARGPVFPAILAMNFAVFGRSVPVAITTARIFNVLNIVLVYMLGRVLYKRRVGLVAAALTLTSYGIFWANGRIDTGSVHMFFLLLSFLFFYKAYRDDWLVLYGVAGVVLGIAFLVKESVIFYVVALLPLVLLAWGLRRSRVATGLTVCLSALVLSVVPWLIYVSNRTGTAWLALSAFAPQQTGEVVRRVGHDTMDEWVIALFLSIPKLIWDSYEKHLLVTTPLAPLLVIAFLIVLIRAAKKRSPADLLIVFGCLIWMPIVFSAVTLGGNPRNSLIIFYLFYIAFAAVLTWLLALSSDWLKKPVLADAGLAFLAGIGVLLQLSYGGTWNLWREGAEHDSYPVSWDMEKEMVVGSRYTRGDQQMVRWMMENIEPDAVLLVDGFFSEPLDFYSGFAWKTNPRIGGIHMDHLEYVTQPPGRPIFVLPYSKFRSELRRYRIVWFIKEESILEEIRSSGARYIVITGRATLFQQYLDSVPWAKRIHTEPIGYVYSIDPQLAAKTERPFFCTGDTMVDDLDWLKQHHPEEYKQVEDALAWADITVDQLAQTTCQLPRNLRY